jgi:hypothetical protein
VKTRKISEKDATTIQGRNGSTRGKQNVCLPCEGTETEQPSIIQGRTLRCPSTMKDFSHIKSKFQNEVENSK